MSLCPQDALRRTWPSQRPGDGEEEQQSARYVSLPVCLGQVCPCPPGADISTHVLVEQALELGIMLLVETCILCVLSRHLRGAACLSQ